MLLPAFDRQKGWAGDGQRSCIGWLNAHCGMSPSAAHDRRRVGYALEQLPVIRQLFELGELSWSKVRALIRIANAENERALASDALDKSASEIERSVRQYRNVSTSEAIEAEDAKADAQYQSRYLSAGYDHQGMVRIRAALAPLEGAAFLKSLARAEDELFHESQGALTERGVRPAQTGLEHEDAAQRRARHLRADALSLMAKKHLAAESVDVRTADRYQVVVHVDAATLHQSVDNPDPHCGCSKKSADRTPLQCHIENGPALAASTARQLADDCSVLSMVHSDGEPLSIGVKSRMWPAAVSRAIKHRDGHCQFPGCCGTRHLQLHHLKHWADGGETSVQNGAALCGFHHRLMHERRYTMEKTSLDSDGKLPKRSVTVMCGNGQTLELQATRKRFRVRRPDGSIVGC
jgi:hypothetical protein